MHPGLQRFQQSIDTSSTRLRVVFAADKSRRIVNVQTYGEKDHDGNVIFNHGLAQDVTDSFLLEANLNGRLSSLDDVVTQLTDREKSVLERVMEGRLNKSIARELDVSERTVESARSRLMKKFGANTSAELVRYSTEYYMLTQLIESVHGAGCLPRKMKFLERIKSNAVFAKAQVDRRRQ